MQAMKTDKIFIGKGAKDYQVICLLVLRVKLNISGNLLGSSDHQCSRVGIENLSPFFSFYFEKKQQQLKFSFSIPTKDKDGKNLEIEFPVNTQEDLKNPSKPSQDDDITNEYNKARPCLKVSFPDD